MKTLLTLLFFLSAFIVTMAQKNKHEETLKTAADYHFNEEQYHRAIQYYRQLTALSEQSGEIHYQLAESYRKTFNYKEAETCYQKAYSQSPQQFPLSLYYHALMLKLNGEFDKSIQHFTEFIFAYQHTFALQDYVEQATIDKAGSSMAKIELSSKQARYPLSSENINSLYNDYAPAIRDSNTLVITSSRVGSNRETIDERNGEAFANNFYFTKQDNQWHDKTKQQFNVINTRYNDGPGCFNGKGDKYYFTACGIEGPQCWIFLSVLKNNRWTEPIALPSNINSRSSESKHPAVSKGGDTLLFASNRLGGLGQFDLWMSINAGGDNWGPAMNLGNTVNTKLNELSPTFTNYSHLFFFASDGHQSFGGLDLYMAKRFSNGTMALYNLDYPFNSTRDDCFISFDKRKVYISSNREGGKGGFDIYTVSIPSVISYSSKLSLKNRDARGDVKLQPRVETTHTLDLLIARNEDRIEYENLTYEKKKIVDKIVSNQIHHLPTRIEDFDGISQEEFTQLTRISAVQFNTYEIEKRFTKTFLARVPSTAKETQQASVTGILHDSLSGQVLAGYKVLLLNKLGEVIKSSTTNDAGVFKFTNIQPTENQYLRLENSPSRPSEKPIIRDLRITATENDNSASLESIYFDFDHSVLRPEAKQVLNDLATFLKNAPSLQVELYAYADDLGTHEYNMRLSEKRGQAVLNYLAAKGVDNTALAVVAKGRQESPSTDVQIQRQLSRRVEFYLNGEQLALEVSVRTYILKMESNWAFLSKSTGIGIENLKKLNGAIQEEPHLFQPIRIPTTAKEISDELFFVWQL